MLNADQIRFYHDEGYLAVDEVFSAAEVAALRAVTDEFVERSRKVTTGDSVFDLEPSHTPEQPRLRRLHQPSEQHEVYRRALTHPTLLGIVSQLIGPNLRTNGDKLNFKLAGVGSPVEWHQDWAFYPHTNDDLLAVGIALDDSTAENGCLMVLPGSHRGEVFDHHQDGRFAGAVTDEAFRADDAVPVPVKVGGVSIHHVRTLHGSAPNRSALPRRLFLIQYCAADAWPLLPGENPWDEHLASVVHGTTTAQARVTDVPVRLPLPPSVHEGSIYEAQRVLRKAMFRESQ